MTLCRLTLSPGEFPNTDPDASERHTVIQLVVDGSLRNTVLAYAKPTAALTNSMKKKVTQSGVPGLLEHSQCRKDVFHINLTLDVFARVV